MLQFIIFDNFIPNFLFHLFHVKIPVDELQNIEFCERMHYHHSFWTILFLHTLWGTNDYICSCSFYFPFWKKKFKNHWCFWCFFFFKQVSFNHKTFKSAEALTQTLSRMISVLIDDKISILVTCALSFSITWTYGRPISNVGVIHDGTFLMSLV